MLLFAYIVNTFSECTSCVCCTFRFCQHLAWHSKNARALRLIISRSRTSALRIARTRTCPRTRVRARSCCPPQAAHARQASRIDPTPLDAPFARKRAQSDLAPKTPRNASFAHKSARSDRDLAPPRASPRNRLKKPRAGTPFSRNTRKHCRAGDRTPKQSARPLFSTPTEPPVAQQLAPRMPCFQ